MKKTDLIRYKDVEEFGKSLGLSQVDMEIVRYKKELIEKLKDRRKKLHMSQAELAKKIGSQQPAIARMEGGLVGQVSMDFLVKIALTLGVTISIKGMGRAA
jgi:DNA-binding XRE family transcriptional regulator